MSSKRKQVKKGGFEYAKIFDLAYPLSPCYRPEGKPEIFKAGWHAGGSAKQCDYEPPVGDLVNIKSTDVINPSQKAWFNRYSCPKASQCGGKKTASKKDGSKKSVKKSSRKSDSYVDKVVLVNLPNNLRPRYRWIVKKRDDGRYVARAPKIGVLIKDLKKKLDNDFNSEHLLPKNFNFCKSVKKSNSKKSVKKSKSKTVKKTRSRK